MEFTAAPGGRQGYLHPRYAASLTEFGEIRHLPHSGAWLLVRPIPASSRCDARAGYRHLLCADWSSLHADLDVCSDLVTVTAVTDPCATVSLAELRRCFPDLVRPYKLNSIIELSAPTPSRHHRKEARRALRTIQVEVADDPASYLDEWESLYDDLRVRHRLTGITAFSRLSFCHQLATPGCVLFRALSDDRAVAMSMWFVVGDVAHYHLSASNAAGYRSSATYALMQTAIAEFAGRGLRLLNLGAAAGIESTPADGLGWFKAGWATCTRPSFLCGRIIDRQEYARLTACQVERRAPSDYFPPYRRGSDG